MNKLSQLTENLNLLFDINTKNNAKVETTAGIADDLYMVSGNLTKAVSEFTFEKKSEKVISDQDKRLNPRLEQRLRVNTHTDNQVWEGTCIDLSMSGMKLRLNHEITQGSQFVCDIYLPYEDIKDYQNQEPLQMKACVVWCSKTDPYYMHGIEFRKISKKQKKLLKICFDYFSFDEKNIE